MHFCGVDGALAHDAEDVGAPSVTVTLPLSGMDGHVDAFNEHQHSAQLFDAAKHPELAFTSTRVEAAGGDRLKTPAS